MADDESTTSGAANGSGTSATSSARPRSAASRNAGASRSAPSRGNTRSSKASEDAMKKQIAELKREVNRLNRALSDQAEEAAETVADLMDAGDNPEVEAAVEEQVFDELTEAEQERQAEEAAAKK